MVVVPAESIPGLLKRFTNLGSGVATLDGKRKKRKAKVVFTHLIGPRSPPTTTLLPYFPALSIQIFEDDL
jgi:hypothetical protein